MYHSRDTKFARVLYRKDTRRGSKRCFTTQLVMTRQMALLLLLQVSCLLWLLRSCNACQEYKNNQLCLSLYFFPPGSSRETLLMKCGHYRLQDTHLHKFNTYKYHTTRLRRLLLQRWWHGLTTEIAYIIIEESDFITRELYEALCCSLATPGII